MRFVPLIGLFVRFLSLRMHWAPQHSQCCHVTKCFLNDQKRWKSLGTGLGCMVHGKNISSETALEFDCFMGCIVIMQKVCIYSLLNNHSACSWCCIIFQEFWGECPVCCKMLWFPFLMFREKIFRNPWLVIPQFTVELWSITTTLERLRLPGR